MIYELNWIEHEENYFYGVYAYITEWPLVICLVKYYYTLVLFVNN